MAFWSRPPFAPASQPIETPEFGFPAGWKSELAARDDQRLAAMLAGDAAQLEAVYSADLRFGHSIGRVDTRAELIRVHAERSLTWSSFAYAERGFRALAPATALMEGRLLARGNDLGVVLNLDLVFLAVWWREAAGWKMLAWQSTNRSRPSA
jgi:hypothetical protein